MADPHGGWHWRALGLTMAAQRKTKRTKGQVITRKDQRRVPPARMAPVRRHSRARRPGH
jgi:hypothetical protein